MELLSPAGNLELALAAFDGGADAVYCGVAGAFNARMRAENFTFDSLGKLIRYARSNGKRVYVTFNTLVKEDELGSMFEALCELAKLQPNALIVQDPGVIHTVKKYFPELKLHASTQMGIHNSAGVAAMQKLGLERVILERQITLPELKKIAENSNIELEVFIHGSLCCSLSGRCLLSGFLFDQSGNRGRCKQPCRRQYSAGSRKGFFLSPGDLCGLPLLDELRSCRITSLKIEGRLRSPDYVWKTARAYRTLLDASSANQAEALHEAENILNTALSRRKTLGFYDFPSRTPLIDGSTSGTFGMPAATVEKITARGITVLTAAPLHLGDRLRFQPPHGGDGESFSLTAMETAPGKRALKVRSNSKIFIPGKFNAAPQYRLLKIGENGFDFSRQASNLPSLRFPLDMAINFSAKKFNLSVNGHIFESPCDFAPAEKHPLQPSAVQQVFSEAMPEPWCAGKINIKINGDFFVPAAELKKLRREFWQQFQNKLTLDEYFSTMPCRMEKFFSEIKQNTAAVTGKFPAAPLLIPGFIPENELLHWQQKISNSYANGCRDFLIGHWHGLTLLNDLHDIRIFSTFPLPVTNSRAAALLNECGVCGAYCAPELSKDDIDALQKNSTLPTAVTDKETPLLVTRIPIPVGEWKNENGKIFNVTCTNGLYKLYSK